MRTFAFVTHPINIKQLKRLKPLTKFLPDFMVMPLIKNNPGLEVSGAKRMLSLQGREIQGYFITWPVLTKKMLELKEEAVLDKLMACSYIAQELAAGILGLGGYISTALDKDSNLAKNLRIPVTTGSAFTAWSVVEAIYRIAKVKNIDLKKTILVVTGAASSIGSLCARRLANYVSKIVTTGSYRDKLEQLKESILNLSPTELIIEEDMHKAVKDADILINATNSTDSPINIDELKPNAIICDVSVASNMKVKPNPRSDITITKGGLVKLPFPTKLGAYTGLTKGIISAPLAETMLLALAEKFVSYSLGENINLDKLEEIANLAVQHGFEVWVPEAPVL